MIMVKTSMDLNRKKNRGDVIIKISYACKSADTLAPRNQILREKKKKKKKNE